MSAITAKASRKMKKYAVLTREPRCFLGSFDFSWEQRKVGDLIEDYIEKTIVQNQYPVLTSSQQQGIVLQEDYFADRQVTTNDNIGYYVLPRGYFTYRSRSDTDMFVFNRNNIINKGIISYYYPVFLPKNCDSNFLLRRLNHGIRKQLSMAAEGTGQKVLAHNKFKNMVVDVPSTTEQCRIGIIFEMLDHLITLHQRKFEKLTNVKKSMLEKMFPQNGSSYPEIRFKGFTDPWEQRKFSDITFPAGEKNRDNLPLESYSITNEHGFVPQDEKFENGGTMREADKRMYYIVSPNSFAYNPARINVGSIGYQNIGKNVIVSSLYEVFKTSEDVDDRLLWHWFKSPDFQKLIMQLQEGGVRLYFYYDKLCMGEVSLPSLEEQRKIGKLFDTLDNLITLHQRKGKAAVTGCSNDANNSKGVYCKARDFGYKCYKKVKSQQIRCLIAVFIFFV